MSDAAHKQVLGLIDDLPGKLQDQGRILVDLMTIVQVCAAAAAVKDDSVRLALLESVPATVGGIMTVVVSLGGKDDGDTLFDFATTVAELRGIDAGQHQVH